ncbi:hypothetical protein [Streptococcus sp. DD13]|uniref:hypothetical protein n=1 Tax=Streptococcus sp. DD13 TaxID=1777881 RepID=UPI00079318A9|nr:hypothetical protein [Streptococcus sp. DD13]KXT78001.1 hypothetical protein STRDD13_01099 [Streptococcus sp. DD13]
MNQEEWLKEFERLNGRPATKEEFESVWGAEPATPAQPVMPQMPQQAPNQGGATPNGQASDGIPPLTGQGSAVAPVQKKSHKGLWISLVSLLLVALVGAGLWFFVFNKTNTSNQAASGNQAGTAVSIEGTWKSDGLGETLKQAVIEKVGSTKIDFGTGKLDLSSLFDGISIELVVSGDTAKFKYRMDFSKYFDDIYDMLEQNMSDSSASYLPSKENFKKLIIQQLQSTIKEDSAMSLVNFTIDDNGVMEFEMEADIDQKSQTITLDVSKLNIGESLLNGSNSTSSSSSSSTSSDSSTSEKVGLYKYSISGNELTLTLEDSSLVDSKTPTSLKFVKE